MPVHLKRKNGEVTPYKNSEYIPAFYFFPKEAMTKLPKELQELPRNPWFIFRDWDAIKIVESDLFLELMMDGYACLTWPYLGIGGDMEAYSGYDPAYAIAHSCGIWVETMTNLGIIPTTNELLKKATPWEQWGYVPVAETQWTMRRVVRAAMHRYNLQALLDTVKQNRCAEDFDDRYSTQKIDFIRKWYHTRTKHPQISLDEFQQAYAEEHNDTWWDVPDTQQDMEQTVVDCADADLFIQALDPQDLEILQLRNKGHSLEEIAQMLGYKTHSAVLKRIQKLGEKYQEFAGTDIGF